MEYGRIPGIEKEVSRIVAGTGQVTQGGSVDEYFKVWDKAFESGINVLDSGREYADGFAEQCIGKWLKSRGNRDKMVIISKGCHHNDYRRRVTPFDLYADVFDSLAFLGVDYFDLYFLHRDDESVPVKVMMDALFENYQAGRIKAYGVSNWKWERVKEANDYAAANGMPELVATSQHFSLAEQIRDPWGGGCVSLTGDRQEDARAYQREKKIPLFAYSSLSLGLLTGRIFRENYKGMLRQGVITEACERAYCYEQNFKRIERAKLLAERKNVTIPALALAYVLNYPKIGGFETFALVGAVTPREVEMNIAASEIQLTTKEMLWLDLKTEDLK